MDRLRRGLDLVQGLLDRLGRRVPPVALVAWRGTPWWLKSYLLLVGTMGTIVVLSLGVQGLTHLAGPHPPTVLAWALRGLRGLVDGVALVMTLTVLVVVLRYHVRAFYDELTGGRRRKGWGLWRTRALPPPAESPLDTPWQRAGRGERVTRRRGP